MKVAILSFTPKGALLQNRIITKFNYEFIVFDLEKNQIKKWLEKVFYQCDAIIFIGAAGIATRLISTLLKGKDVDPGVLVMDELGKYVIPILSGHIGGSNELSIEIAKEINAIPIITTATDINGKFAVDVWSTKNNCKIEDISKIKYISSAVLKDELIGLYSEFEIVGELPEEIVKTDKTGSKILFGKELNESTVLKNGICISLNGEKTPFENTINIIPQIITLGIGCRRGTEMEKLEKFVFEELKNNHISRKSILGIATIDLKKDEIGLIDFGKKYNFKITTYTKEELQNVKGDFTGSEFVKSITGVDNVCERSCMLKSDGELIVKKIAKDGMTLAIAKGHWGCKF